MTSQAKFPDQYLTVGDVAKMMRCSIPTIYRWVAKGDFPRPMRFGGSSRWSLNEIMSFLDRRKDNSISGKETVEASSRSAKRAKRTFRKKRD